jgi:hypothetical protein
MNESEVDRTVVRMPVHKIGFCRSEVKISLGRNPYKLFQYFTGYGLPILRLYLTGRTGSSEDGNEMLGP